MTGDPVSGPSVPGMGPLGAAESGTDTVPLAGGSPLAGLRGRLREKQIKTTVDIPLPAALEKEIAVRYRALTWEKEDEIRERNAERDDRRRRIEREMDELINACDCILHRSGDGWVPLTDDGRKVRFDRRLAGALDIPSGGTGGQAVDTHVIVRGLFAVAAGGLAEPPDGVSAQELWEQALAHADHLIDVHHTQFMVWLKGGADVNDAGVRGELAEELLGE